MCADRPIGGERLPHEVALIAVVVDRLACAFQNPASTTQGLVTDDDRIPDVLAAPATWTGGWRQGWIGGRGGRANTDCVVGNGIRGSLRTRSGGDSLHNSGGHGHRSISAGYQRIRHAFTRDRCLE